MNAASLDAPLHRDDAARRWLVADIGGTNARFALAQPGSDGGAPRLRFAATRRVIDYPQIGRAVRDYLDHLPADERVDSAVFAVACPVDGDRIAFVNSPWTFSVSTLQQELGLQHLHVLNDFAAVAWAVHALQARDIEVIGSPVRASANGVCAVVGPGTGLGVAAVKRRTDGLIVIESEGGHAGFSPSDDMELDVLRFLMRRHPRVSVERLLSGAGLVSLYHAHCALAGSTPSLQTPEQVTAAARHDDAAARAAARAFCAICGSFAGDVALMFGAWDGVYLAGGVLAHVLDEAGRAAFRARFEAKGRFSERLARVPTLHIVREDVGRIGAAMFAASRSHAVDRA